MTHTDVQAWLDRYVAAWVSYDPAAIADLFSDAAEYRYHPWDEPVRGRDAIVASWTDPSGGASGRDEPGTYSGRYEPYAVEGSRAVATGVSTYWTDAMHAVERQRYHNIFLVDFDADGRCRSFTELYLLQRPKT